MNYLLLALTIQDWNSNPKSLNIEIQCQKLQIKDQRFTNSPLDEAELDGFVSRVEKISRGNYNSGDLEALRIIGIKLYSSIFADTWSEYLMRISHEIHQVSDQSKGLKIAIHAQGEIAEATPWELLCDPDTKSFLGCSASSTIVRMPSADLRGELQHMEPQVRVLLAGASPINRSSVHARDEIDKIYQCLKKLEPTQAKINRRFKVSWQSFRQAVKKIKPHILHLVAHGSEEGVLFQNSDNTDIPISCEALYNFIGDIEDLRLVILNICASESVIKRQFALHPRRIPSSSGIWAIVVTRATISSDASYEFSKALYEALIEGKSITQSVGEARNYLQGMNNAPKGLEWSTPVLYEACNVIPFPPLAAIRKIADGIPLRDEQVCQLREKQNGLNHLINYITEIISILDNPDDLDISVLNLTITPPTQQCMDILPEILDEFINIRNCPTNLIEISDQICSITNQAMELFNKFIPKIGRLEHPDLEKKLLLEVCGYVNKVGAHLGKFLSQ